MTFFFYNIINDIIIMMHILGSGLPNQASLFHHLVYGLPENSDLVNPVLSLHVI